MAEHNHKPGRVVWKYRLELIDTHVMLFAPSTRFLAVGEQDDLRKPLALWVELDPKEEVREIKLHVVGTGQRGRIAESWNYIGTVQMQTRPFAGLVWHLYWEAVPPEGFAHG